MSCQLQLCRNRTVRPSGVTLDVQVTDSGRAARHGSAGSEVSASQRASDADSARSGTVPTYVTRPAPKALVVTAAKLRRCGCSYRASTVAPSGINSSAQPVPAPVRAAPSSPDTASPDTASPDTATGCRKLVKCR